MQESEWVSKRAKWAVRMSRSVDNAMKSIHTLYTHIVWWQFLCCFWNPDRNGAQKRWTNTTCKCKHTKNTKYNRISLSLLFFRSHSDRCRYAHHKPHWISHIENRKILMHVAKFHLLTLLSTENYNRLKLRRQHKQNARSMRTNTHKTHQFILRHLTAVCMRLLIFIVVRLGFWASFRLYSPLTKAMHCKLRSSPMRLIILQTYGQNRLQ